jgi:hypothetical protein
LALFGTIILKDGIFPEWLGWCILAAGAGFPEWLGWCILAAGAGYITDSCLFFLRDGYNG